MEDGIIFPQDIHLLYVLVYNVQQIRVKILKLAFNSNFLLSLLHSLYILFKIFFYQFISFFLPPIGRNIYIYIYILSLQYFISNN